MKTFIGNETFCSFSIGHGDPNEKETIIFIDTIFYVFIDRNVVMKTIDIKTKLKSESFTVNGTKRLVQIVSGNKRRRNELNLDC